MAEDKLSNGKNKGAKKNKSGPHAGVKAKPVIGEDGSVDFVREEGEEPNVSLFVAVGIAVAALVVGLIGGYFLAPKSATTDFTQQPPAAAGNAPALSPEQLNSQQLPSSHPPIPGGSAEASGTEQSAPEGEAQAPEGQEENAESSGEESGKKTP